MKPFTSWLEQNRAIVVAAVVFTAGCSMKPGQSSGLQIQLVPQAATKASLDRSFIDLLAFAPTLTAQGLPASLDDLTCFGVNAYSNSIPTTSVCNSSVKKGVMDGFRSGIDSTFSLTIPTADPVTFEAYGYSGSCVDMLSGGTTSASVYRLGQITTGASTDFKSVLQLPVSFNASSLLPCNSSPYTVFSDSFNAYGTAGALDAASNNVWITANTANAMQYDSTNQAIALATAATGAYVELVNNQAFDGSKPYYSIAADIMISAIGPSAGCTLSISLGLSDSTSASVANTMSCQAQFSSGASGANAISTLAGTTAAGAGYVLTSAPTFTPAATSGTYHLFCEFKQSGTSFSAIQHVSDASNIDYASPATTITPTCATATGCNRLFVATNWTANCSGGSATGTIDNIVLKQADTAQ